MKRLLLGMVVILFASALGAQNWDINVLHKVNGWDNKFVRNYNKVISKSEPYVAIGVPVAMAVAGWIRHDKDLLKDALYVGTSVAGAFVVTYGMKYLVDRERPYDRWPDRVHAYSRESSPSFPSGHTATAFALANLSQVVCHRSFGLMGLFGGCVTYERRRSLPIGCVGRSCHWRRLCRSQCLRKPLAEQMVVR